MFKVFLLLSVLSATAWAKPSPEDCLQSCITKNLIRYQASIKCANQLKQGECQCNSNPDFVNSVRACKTVICRLPARQLNDFCSLDAAVTAYAGGVELSVVGGSEAALAYELKAGKSYEELTNEYLERVGARSQTA